MEDIIATIDAAVGCQRCGKSLESSVSDDFCGEWCQRSWHATRVDVQLDHQSGLDFGAFATPSVPGPLTVWIRPDTRGLVEGFRRMSEALVSITRSMSVSASTVMEAMTALSESGEAHAARRSLMDKALEARRGRSTGPSSPGRAPRAINPRRAR